MLPYVWIGGLQLAACESWTIENALHADDETPPGTPDTGTSDPLSLPPGGPVPVQGCATCDRGNPAWDLQVEWRVELPGDLGHAGTPVVAHLDDDDGDGVIGSSRDMPEILVLFTDADHGWIDARHADGTPFRVYDQALHPISGEIAVADLDGDAVPEIVALEDDERWGTTLTALAVDGTVLWRSSTVDPIAYTCLPVVADLEGDGRAEVLCDDLVLDGQSGETRWVGTSEVFAAGSSTVADLDLDGRSEVVFANRVRRADGTLWWTDDSGATGRVYPAVAQLDEDPEGELLFAFNGKLVARDTDGTKLWEQQVTYAGESRPCLADFDGDGEIEVAVAFSSALAMLERDGTLVWTRPIDDYSTAASCSAFDFDHDGDAEIAYADHHTFGLYCGGDGSPLLEVDHSSATYNEFPVVADVDADGSAEVIVSFFPTPGGMLTKGFTVYGNPVWPGTGAVFPQPDYRDGTQHDDGTVTGRTASWLGDGLVRGRVADGPVVPSPLPVDLVLTIADPRGGCDGLSLALQVENRGPGDVPAGRSVEVRAIDSAISGQFLGPTVASIPLPAVPSGTRTDAFRLDLSPDRLGLFGLLLVIPSADGLECDAVDQEIFVPLACD